jgi:tRNA-dihydrouridine synthase A
MGTNRAPARVPNGLNMLQNPMKNNEHSFSVAPMMDWTDRHCRAFHRQLSRRVLLYSEMVTADAVIRGDRARLIGCSAVEHPVALQLGGSDPAKLAEATKIGVDFGYGEINLNVGCPSDRVQEGRFGACLMREPALVAECVAAMRAAAGAVPVTVKHRLGVDEQDPEQSLFGFVDTVAQADVTTFIVHARKAWLQGLSPRENRDVPPLDYAIVRRLKIARPERTIILNGGLGDLDQAQAEMAGLDGVMLGRAAYQNPAILADVDRRFYGVDNPCSDMVAVLADFKPYIADQLARGVHLHAMTRHVLGLFHGRPGGRRFRQVLTVEGVRKGAGLEVLDRALECVRRVAA